MTAERTLDCPTCDVTMAKREEHDVTIDYCTECGGVWLDPGELDAVTDGHGHGSHHRDVDVDLDDDEEWEEDEYEEEDEGGLLGFVADAISGGEEEEGEWEEEEEWGGEEEFGGGEEEF